MEALQKVWPRIEEIGELLAISPQDIENSRRTKEELGLTFPVLSDRGNTVANVFGLVYTFTEKAKRAYRKLGINLPDYNGDDSWTLPIPATYIVAPSGRVTRSFLNADYTKRSDPERIFQELSAAEAERV